MQEYKILQGTENEELQIFKDFHLGRMKGVLCTGELKGRENGRNDYKCVSMRNWQRKEK